MFSTVAIHRRRRVGVDFLYMFIYIYLYTRGSYRRRRRSFEKNSKHAYARVCYNMYVTRRHEDVFAILPFVQIYLTLSNRIYRVIFFFIVSRAIFLGL